MTSIFISHRSVDNLEAEGLKQWLEMEGYERLFSRLRSTRWNSAGL